MTTSAIPVFPEGAENEQGVSLPFTGMDAVSPKEDQGETGRG